MFYYFLNKEFAHSLLDTLWDTLQFLLLRIFNYYDVIDIGEQCDVLRDVKRIKVPVSYTVTYSSWQSSGASQWMYTTLHIFSTEPSDWKHSGCPWRSLCYKVAGSFFFPILSFQGLLCCNLWLKISTLKIFATLFLLSVLFACLCPLCSYNCLGIFDHKLLIFFGEFFVAIFET